MSGAASTSGRQAVGALLERLQPHAKKTLEQIMANRRGKLWADTPIELRVRSFPKIRHSEP
jgi:hypothetical protein